jgi:hypothetical protein
MVYKMTDFEIVQEYMTRRYPNAGYAIRKGNNCVWVTLNARVDMYFVVKNGKIVDIQID